MASIGREGKNGERKRIMFRDAEGKQQSLRLGKCSERAAQSALAGFERVLEAHRIGSTLHPDGVRWLEAIDDTIHERVARFGLVEPRECAEQVTLGELIERFYDAATVKPSTLAAYKQTTDALLAELGADTPLDDITPAEADGWRKAIAEPVTVEDADGTRRTKRLAPATIAKRVLVARNVFGKAVRWGLIASNPFTGVRSGSQSNPDRAFYVDPETIRAILAACPDDHWRAIIALCRFTGLRCPSEIAALRWADVNWERGRLTVRSAKTAHHEGHAVRVVPIVPEVRAILQDLFDAAEPGTEAVLPRRVDGSANLRTHFQRIIERAGCKPWPRLFHNLRASCATDWVERFPAHVVAGWLGHSPMIAASHYLQTRDAHFDMAAGIEGAATNPATRAATNPATHARPQDATDAHEDALALANAGVSDAGCEAVVSGEKGESGRNRTRTCDLCHVTAAL